VLGPEPCRAALANSSKAQKFRMCFLKKIWCEKLKRLLSDRERFCRFHDRWKAQISWLWEDFACVKSDVLSKKPHRHVWMIWHLRTKGGFNMNQLSANQCLRKSEGLCLFLLIYIYIYIYVYYMYDNIYIYIYMIIYAHIYIYILHVDTAPVNLADPCHATWCH